MKQGLVFSRDGDELWFKDDRFHREDGPALQFIDGEKRWCIEGKLHRLDGPAIVCSDGTKEWYLDGNLVYSSYEDNTSYFELSNDMRKQIIKYKLLKNS